MVTVIVVLVYIFVVVFDFLPSKKNRDLKEIVVYCVLASISFCVLILYSLNITIPGSSKPIKNAVEKLLSILRGLF